MKKDSLKLGFCLCGSFCTFSKAIKQLEGLCELGIDVEVILSDAAQSTDTRFGRAEDIKEKLRNITKKDLLLTIRDVEPIGPQARYDALIVAPCTGNTLAKLNNGITDSPVTMACKAHLRNERPVVIALATNDALGASLENIGGLMNKKNFYFVPFSQDDYANKPKSMVAHFDKIYDTVLLAIEGKQIQPIIEG